MKILPITNIKNQTNLQTFKGLWGEPYPMYLEYAQFYDLAEFHPYHPFSDESEEMIKEAANTGSIKDTTPPNSSCSVVRESVRAQLCDKLPFTEAEYNSYKKDFVPGKSLNETEIRVAKGLKNNGLYKYLNEMHECLKPVPLKTRLQNFVKKLFR